MSQPNDDRATVTSYLRQLADRIDKGEEIKVSVLVDAHGRAGGVFYGHLTVGERFLQIEDCIFRERVALLLPQLMAQLGRTPGPMGQPGSGGTAGSTH